MTRERGPHNRGSCPFQIVANDPLSAEDSINHCVDCVKGKHTQLASLHEDLYQIAFLTVLEETPKYDPNHPSGASFITFIKAKVCTRLWSERRKVLQSIPFPIDEYDDGQQICDQNLLVERLTAEACMREQLADTVIRQIEVEFLQKLLPTLLAKLTKKQRQIIELKFFEQQNGVEIAQVLDISQGRVSQLTHDALAKLGKAYLNALDNKDGNPYRDT